MRLVACKIWFYLFFNREGKRVGQVLEVGQAAGKGGSAPREAKALSTKEERKYTLAEMKELGLFGCNFAGAKITNNGTINCGVVPEKSEKKPAKGWFYRIFYWRGVDHPKY